MVLGVAASGALLAAEQQVSATYVFDPPRVVKTGEFARVTIASCAMLEKAGMPEVPCRTGKILLPPGVEVVRVEASFGEEETLTLERPLTFGRTPVPIGVSEHPSVARAALDAPDAATYGADVAYPASRVELVSVQKMNGYGVAVVRVYPAQYLPLSGRLLFVSKLKVTVTTDDGKAVLSALSVQPSATGPSGRVTAFVDNPEAVALYETVKAQTAQPLTTYDYLLITKASLTNSFSPLVAQKIADGLSVKVETVENIVAGYTGVDDAAKVRTYITYAYTNWNTSYVLLGGDISTVPYRKAYAYCGGADTNMPCDLYFACLDGSWNSDGDGYWGEPNDGEGGGEVDLLAEVYVGRAPVDTEAEVANFVAKTVYYEQNGHANSGSARFLGEYLGNYSGINAHGGDGLDTLLPSFSDYGVSWLDDRPSNSETWGTVECVDKLNESPHLVAHFGHANEIYALRMNESDIGDLSNAEPFLLDSAGCYCGAFDYSDCFAEEMVKSSAYGAFAVIMNSRYGWFNASEEWLFTGEFMASFYNELLMQGNRNVGVANQLAKHDMVGSVEASGDMVYRWCYYEITLFGDPHVPLQGWDALQVSPSDTFEASGYAGGPFAPGEQVYQLCNTGDTSFNWTATHSANWLSLSSASGRLGAGATCLITATINAQANALAPGNYEDTLVFSNAVSGGVKTRSVHLTVRGDVTFSPAVYTCVEAGGVEKVITVVRGGHTNLAATVDFAVSSGTATAGADFVATNGTLSFAVGETRKMFAVEIVDDAFVEPDETVLLTLSNPTGGVTLGDPSTATLTLTDDDTPIVRQLTTTFEGGNGSNGNMFDLVPKTKVMITAFDVNSSASTGTSFTVYVYYRTGTSFGYETNSSAWTLLASKTVTSVGSGLPTHVDLSGSGFTCLAGQKYGIYVHSASGLSYTTGSNTYEDAAIQLVANCGKGMPAFTGNTFAPRIWNGTVAYTLDNSDGFTVCPDGGLAATGYEGGPFSPWYKVYMLTNTGSASLTWRATNAQNWFSVQPASGMLAAGESGMVTVSVNANANELTPGTYIDTVVFSNTVSGCALSRGVALSVLEIPGEISVSDSIPPVSDLNLPYGKTIVGLARTEHVTVNNLDPVHGLTLSEIKVQRTASSSGVRLPRLTDPVGNVTKTMAACGRAPCARPSAASVGERLSAPSDVPCFGIEMLGQQLVSYRTADPGALTTIAGSGGDLMVGVDFLNGDFTKLYALDYDVNEFVWFDTASGVKTVVGQAAPLSGHSWTGQAGDPGGLLYASSTDGNESMLYTIDPETATVTEVGSITGCPVIIDIAINSAGEMYGVDIALDSLVWIDKTTGAATVVGSLGVDSSYAQGLDFDEENDVLYWAAYTTQAELRVIDTTTGNSALVAAFPSSTELNIAVANGGVRCFEVRNAPSLPFRIPPGGNVTFDVAYRPAKVGADEAFLEISSNDADDPKVTVALSGEGIPDYLSVSPGIGFGGSGHPGGPFTPASQIYVVSNNNAVSISWSAADHPDWVSVSPETGSLASGAAASVTVAFNAAAAALPEGWYSGDVIFSNLTTTISHSRSVVLEVFTTPVVRVAPPGITVTNLLGHQRETLLQIGNAAWADATLNFSLGASETSRNAVPATLRAAARDFTLLPKDARYRAGELLVRFAEGVSGAARATALAAAGGGTVTRTFKLVSGLAVVKLPEGMSMADALVNFNRTVGILYAQPNYLHQADRMPNDPLFPDYLWGMDNTGQTGGTADVDIDAPEAWESGVGGPSVTVAVIDTGVDYGHEDLAANMWRNPGEIPGNGIDDDGNGYVDDLYGYDFCNDDADPMDDHDHGTHCAGTIGAVGDNGLGVAGVCWNVRIMAMKFLDASGNGYTDAAISCMEYAVQMGARVLSNSWGGAPYEQAMKDAIDAAWAADVLFVAAAGNSYGNNNDTDPHYPSSYESDNVIAVMSVDATGAMSEFSNFGPQSVDLAAPGSDIVSCWRGGGYVYMSGTSMAAPHVSGACALLLSLNSGASYQQVKNALMATTDSSLPGMCVAGGLMNLADAVTYTPAWLRLSPVAGESVPPGAWSDIAVTADAGAMAAGTYEGLICVRCNDRDTPVTNVPVTMVVLQDNLKILPEEGWVAEGFTGGPFSPSAKVYTLTNSGSSSLSWTAVGATMPWVSVLPATGKIAAGQAVQVTASLNSQTAALSQGDYSGWLAFSNVTSSAVQSRKVELSVYERVFTHFEWDRVASTQYVGTPFGVEISAIDNAGSVFPGFTGKADLYAANSMATNWNVVTGTNTWNYPFSTYYHDARTQVIYLKEEVGNASLISSLSLYVSSLPGQEMKSWTIRMKHTSLESYSESGWQTNDWTIMVQTNLTVTSVGWLKIDFDCPFVYNGTNNLLVDFSFNNTSYTWDGYSWCEKTAAYRSLCYRTDSGYGDPLLWSGAVPYGNLSSNVPVIRIEKRALLPLSPTVTDSFIDGAWSGNMTLSDLATNIVLIASDRAGHVGISDTFDVVEPVIELPEAVDNVTQPWSTGGASGWSGQKKVTHDGEDAARSGRVGNRQSSWMETTVSDVGKVSFWWRVSSEAEWDWFEFYVDDVLVDRISGESGWLQKAVTLAEGSHTLKWVYIKDATDLDPVGQDCGWVDQFVLNDGAIGLAEAVDNAELTWSSGGASMWNGQVTETHDGVDAARSGMISHRQSTWMSTQVTGAGSVSFWWRASSEAGWDWLEFYVDDVLVDRLTGESGWVRKVQALSAGSHTLKWRYVKDGADIDPVGQDCGWVDQFVGASQSALPSEWLLEYGLPTDGSADYLDSDGDGMNNWEEWFAGTIPTNGLSLLRLEAVTPDSRAGGFRIRWQSVAGKRYWLESSDMQTFPIFFTPFVSNVLGEAVSTEVFDSRPAADGKRLYRVGVQED